MVDTRLCPRCNQTKPLTDFPKDRSRPSGVFSYCKSCNYKHSRKWVLENKDRAAEYQREYKENNSERLREVGRQYAQKRYRENRELYRQYLRQRRARKRGGIPVTQEQMQQRVKECGGACVYCGDKYAHIDHVVAISRGGHDVLGNLVPACDRCNRSKGASEWVTWFRRRSFYSLQREQHIARMIADYLAEYGIQQVAS